MKIICVTLDDHDSPLIGMAIVNDDEADATADRLKREGYVVAVHTPDSVEDIRRAMEDE